MIDYVKSEKNSKNYFFRNELGGRLSYGSLISKIRRIGRQSGVMVVEGQSWLSPHKFRHTFATLLLAATHDLRFVQEQLGHQQQKTTEIYINAAAGIFGGEMELFQKRLSFAENEGFLPYFIENSSQTAK
jgi:site-specific recombinase XerD